MSKPAPTSTQTDLGSRRWTVEIVSDQSVMEAGELVETEREVFGSFGRTVRDRHYRFGTPSVGGPAPDHMPRGAVIDQTDDPKTFLVKVRGERALSETKMLMGPEVFEAFGFAAPETP